MKITEEMSKNEKDNDDGVRGLINEMHPLPSKYSPQQNPHRNNVGDERHANHGVYGRYDDDQFTHMMPKYTHVSSPVSGFSLKSDGYSSSPFSGRPPFSGSVSPMEEFKSPMSSSGSFNCHKSLFSPDLTVRKKANDSLIDDLDLCGAWRRVQLNLQRYSYNSCDLVDASIDTNRIPFRDCSYGNYPSDVYRQEGMNDFKRAFFKRNGDQLSFPSNLPMSPASEGFFQDNRMAGSFGARHCDRRPDIMMSQSVDEIRRSLNDELRRSIDSFLRRNNHFYGGNVAPELTASLGEHRVANASPYAHQNGMSLLQERSNVRFSNSTDRSTLWPYLFDENIQQCDRPLSNARAFPIPNTSFPQADLDAITSEGSFIMQGEGLNYVVNEGFDHQCGQRKGAWRETGYKKHLHKWRPDIRCQASGNCEIPRIAGTGCSFPFLPRCNSVAEARGYIYLLAKDQHGCRFLQRMVDESGQEDIQVIFDEIIDHVAELMMSPSGNYLMQKLLDVCTEEQRMQIIQMVTLEPGQLVKISLDSHGTRVVQRLIETLQPGQQISLVASALEPGFLELMKDLNGNHVIQRCLEILRNEDKKFIFVAAAMYCVEIATHQVGCHVLQRCIDFSSGEHGERLIAEISANALLLAQHQYGNYVVQAILDLQNPDAAACIISQFEGRYVQLSMEKFSSHVVEKCFAKFDSEDGSKIIYELLSAPHFEQLIVDPHANYALQSALKHSSGEAYNALVDAILSHEAISRNSPYSKKIFSMIFSQKHRKK